MSRTWLLVGLVCYYVDKVLNVAVALRRHLGVSRPSELDKTGRLVKEAKGLEVAHYDPKILFAYYPGDFAHSLWRSQELSLFRRYQDYLERPRLDFGCGDGSFSSVLFNCVDYGVDYDEVALHVAQGYKVYSDLLCCDGASLSLKSSSIQSVYSNSVLEHVDNLEHVLSELYRILSPGGVLMLTVPVSAFTRHIAKYFGQRESAAKNRQFYHKNMHAPEWWSILLQEQGYSIAYVQHYQPDWFTFAYRVMKTRVLSFVLRHGLSTNRRYRSAAARMVATSLAQSAESGNIFVIARR